MRVGGAVDLRRWWLEGTIALLVLCLAAKIAWFEARARAQQAEPPQSVLAQLSERLDRQPHECIPLGWYPAGRPSRGYYPDYNADIAQRTGPFQSGWVAVVPADVGHGEAADVKSVLDELARVGLVERRTLPDGMHYTLTPDGRPYLYERNDLGNNVEDWPFLCFSHLRTTGLAWSGPAVRDADGWSDSRRVRFKWTSEVNAPWVTPFLRAHAVALPPVSNPAQAEARRYIGRPWRLARVNFEFGLVENRAAWTARASAPNER
jgi:hypothetical protein